MEEDGEEDMKVGIIEDICVDWAGALSLEMVGENPPSLSFSIHNPFIKQGTAPTQTKIKTWCWNITKRRREWHADFKSKGERFIRLDWCAWKIFEASCWLLKVKTWGVKLIWCMRW